MQRWSSLGYSEMNSRSQGTRWLLLELSQYYIWCLFQKTSSKTQESVLFLLIAHWIKLQQKLLKKEITDFAKVKLTWYVPVSLLKKRIWTLILKTTLVKTNLISYW